MKFLWPAIRDRFEADKELVRAGRRIYYGMIDDSRQTHPPYVETHLENRTEQDGFPPLDLETYWIKFTLVSGQNQPDELFDIEFEMIRVFDDCVMTSSNFTHSRCQRLPSSGPTLDGNNWTSFLEYDMDLHRTALRPAFRGQ